MADELACQKDIAARCVMPRSLRYAEVVTQYIQIMTRKEASKPSRVIVRQITSSSRLEHLIVVTSFDGLLVVDNSIVSFLVEVYISSRTFLGLEMHKSQTLGVRFQAFHITELRTNDILNSKSALKQEL